MRIGHYMRELWHQGGVASYIRRVSAAQAAAGHEVLLFDGRSSPAPAHAAEAEQEVTPVGSAQELFDGARRRQVEVLNLHTDIDLLPAKRVPTVRTLHNHAPYCPSGSRYLKRWGQPCDRKYTRTGCLWGHVVDHCGSIRPKKMRGNFRRIQREQRVLAHLPVIAVSRFQKRQMLRSSYPGEQIHVLHSPAPDVERAPAPIPRAAPPRFLYLGRIAPEKGLAWLLRAFAQVQVPAHLDVAGDGDLLDDMKRRAEELNLTERVTFHGWLGNEDVDTLIRKARAVVFPSVWHEPAGLVTLEAASHGRPVIASRVGGIPEYARDPFALLVPPNDEHALADRIETLATDPDRAERMGRAGRKMARSRFAMEPFLKKLDGRYEQVVAQERGAV